MLACEGIRFPEGWGKLDMMLKSCPYPPALLIFFGIRKGRIFLPNHDPQAKVTTILIGAMPKMMMGAEFCFR